MRLVRHFFGLCLLLAIARWARRPNADHGGN